MTSTHSILRTNLFKTVLKDHLDKVIFNDISEKNIILEEFVNEALFKIEENQTDHSYNLFPCKRANRFTMELNTKSLISNRKHIKLHRSLRDKLYLTKIMKREGKKKEFEKSRFGYEMLMDFPLVNENTSGEHEFAFLLKSFFVYKRNRLYERIIYLPELKLNWIIEENVIKKIQFYISDGKTYKTYHHHKNQLWQSYVTNFSEIYNNLKKTDPNNETILIRTFIDILRHFGDAQTFLNLQMKRGLESRYLNVGNQVLQNYQIDFVMKSLKEFSSHICKKEKWSFHVMPSSILKDDESLLMRDDKRFSPRETRHTDVSLHDKVEDLLKKNVYAYVNSVSNDKKTKSYF